MIFWRQARQQFHAFSFALMLTASFATSAATLETAIAVDGDTLRIGGERVRILGLDAPEMHARCLAESRMAWAAFLRMDDLVRDGVTVERRGLDRYQRTLAVVRDSRGRDVATVMIREGLARPYDGRRRQGWCG